MCSSGQDSSFSSEGSHSEIRAVKTQKRRKLVQEEQQDPSTKELVSFIGILFRAISAKLCFGLDFKIFMNYFQGKNELATADLDYARSSLVMVESDVFTGETKSDSDDIPAVEPAGIDSAFF